MANRKTRRRKGADTKRFPLYVPTWLYVHYNQRAYNADESLNAALIRVLRSDAEKHGAITAPPNDNASRVQ